MIKRIELRNFQRHEQLTVCPADGVTVIVGPSHAGKSAIMRAINWAVFNKPAGASFIRHGSETASVIIETEKGVITRTKSTKGKNEYRIELHDSEPLVFTGFGQNVPSAVADFFELEEINFQPQMSLPFLICSSGGEISRKLNQIANLDKIDTTLAELGRISRQIAQNLGSARSRMEVAFASVKALTWVDNAEQVLLDLEKLHSKRTGLVGRVDSIFRAIENFRKASAVPIEEYEQRIAAFKKAITKGMQIANSDTADRDRLVALYNQLADVLDRISELQKRVTTAADVAATAKKAYVDAMPETCPVCGGPMGGADAIHSHS